MNDPINHIDLSGLVSKKVASELIRENASRIILAGKEFNVSPAILAASIFTEQVKNVNITESVEDFTQWMLGMDCSVGIAQVRISTAKKVEDAGYIDVTGGVLIRHTTSLFSIKLTETSVVTREDRIYHKLTNSETNIRYAAAYLAMIQDIWEDAYPTIDQDTAVLATLYNIGGENKEPHQNPISNTFGNFAESYSDYMHELLGV
jgi:hypothetical protein